MSRTVEFQLLDIGVPMDIVRARSEARRIAASMGFCVADQTRLATSVSELARNVLQHAGKGTCQIADICNETELAIQIVFQDNGPGIPDIVQAMQDGYSTHGGLGAGLPGTSRLMDRFHIESQPGLTRVTIAMIRRRNR